MVSRRAHQRGVSYLALLLAVAITNGALAAGATVWSHWQRRERETQLLWAGDQIRRAIVAYAQAAADRGAGYPLSLQDLLLDSRTPERRRFLRQIYEDPMARNAEWGLIRNPQGQLVGVFSRAIGVPAKKARFPSLYAEFEGAKSYADWRFAAVVLPALKNQPPALVGTPAAPAAERGASGPVGPPAQPSAQPSAEPSAEPHTDTPPAPPDAEPEPQTEPARS